ncbi:hypothetical protein ABZ517_05210 [Streptomyces scabiei]|uniref:hypothetical protein n=1 Tax=Streptomyces scabiei TaxID=1930 RepID=UPI003402E83A
MLPAIAGIAARVGLSTAARGTAATASRSAVTSAASSGAISAGTTGANSGSRLLSAAQFANAGANAFSNRSGQPAPQQAPAGDQMGWLRS